MDYFCVVLLAYFEIDDFFAHFYVCFQVVERVLLKILLTFGFQDALIKKYLLILNFVDIFGKFPMLFFHFPFKIYQRVESNESIKLETFFSNKGSFILDLIVFNEQMGMKKVWL